MKLDSKSLPGPICQSCLAGKMYANPFSSSITCSTCPLELVHSNVHQVPYSTFSGYCYWITFIDDYSRFHFILSIHAKSDVFDAFKQFKALRTSASRRSKHCMMTRDGSTWARPCSNSPPSMILSASTLSKCDPNRMVLQNAPIVSCQSESLPCWQNLVL